MLPFGSCMPFDLKTKVQPHLHLYTFASTNNWYLDVTDDSLNDNHLHYEL